MKTLIRYFLINLGALYLATTIIQGLTYTGGVRSLLIGGVVFTLINLLLVPLLKILFLPLNLLTLGIFAWLINVLALYALTTAVSEFKLVPYTFGGFQSGIINLPSFELTTFLVAVIASFVIGIITHMLQWLAH